mgnify:CR=1 FL=1|jgi:translation initiation factor IF-2
MKNRRLPILLIVATIVFLSAITESSAQNININEDPVIRDLMDKYEQWNREESTIQGWRIQVINTDDRRKMEITLSDFRQLYPDIKYVKWRQLSPYYKVIIGAFESKLDVLAYLQVLKEDFPSAIPVIEKIDKKELLNIK